MAEDEPGLESQGEDASFSVSEDVVSPASDFFDLVFICVDCDFWKVPFYVHGGAVVLPKRVGFSVVAVHGGFIVNASLFSQGEYLDADGGQEVLLNVEALALGESSDAIGGALVLLERRLSPVGRSRQCQPPPWLQLSDGVLRRERRRKGAAGASTSGSLRIRTERLSLGPRPLDRVVRRVWRRSDCWCGDSFQVVD